MKQTEARDWYSSRLEEEQTALGRHKKRSAMFSWLRLLAFLAAAAVVYIFWELPWPRYLGIFGGIALFLFLLRIHQGVKEQIALSKARVSILEFELKQRFRGAYEDLSQEYSAHAYAGDLDLFSEHGLFSLLDRTFSNRGRDCLLEDMLDPATGEKELSELHSMHRELADDPEWRLRFSGQMKVAEEEREANSPTLEDWINRHANRLKGGLALRYGWPVLSGVALFLAAVGVLSWTPFIWIFIAGLLIAGVRLGRHKEPFDSISDLSEDMARLEALLPLIAHREWKSHELLDDAGELQGEEGAIHAVKRLSRIRSMIDSRRNLIIGIVLNSLVLWDEHCANRLRRWVSHYGDKVSLWYQIIYRFEARSSRAQFVFNHSSYFWPTAELAHGELNAEQLGHPSLDPEERVDNSFELQGDSRIAMVTGANMAGKSTFLRAVGVNWILAHMGLPVCAKKFSFGPAPLLTSMRAVDSLSSGKSYFFSELERLKSIVEHLENGRPALILLDEILKGTNSEDQSTGSRGLIEKLLNYDARALVATHDLSLCDLEEHYPNKVLNYRFETDVKGDTLTFDYKLLPGICKTRNATVLLERMGLMAKQ